MARSRPDRKKHQWIILSVLVSIALVMAMKTMFVSRPHTVQAGVTELIPAGSTNVGAGKQAVAIATLPRVVVDWSVDAMRDPFDLSKLMPEQAPATTTISSTPAGERPRAAKLDAASLRRLATAKLNIQGTITGTKPRVVINGQMYEVGDVVDGFTVRQIASRKVVLEKDGVEVAIDM